MPLFGKTDKAQDERLDKVIVALNSWIKYVEDTSKNVTASLNTLQTRIVKLEKFASSLQVVFDVKQELTAKEEGE